MLQSCSLSLNSRVAFSVVTCLLYFFSQWFEPIPGEGSSPASAFSPVGVPCKKNAEEILKWLNQLIFSESNSLYQFVYQPVIGREYWQAVRSAGLGSTGVYGRVSAGFFTLKYYCIGSSVRLCEAMKARYMTKAKSSIGNPRRSARSVEIPRFTPDSSP